LHPHEKWLKANPTYNASQQSPLPPRDNCTPQPPLTKGKGLKPSPAPRPHAFAKRGELQGTMIEKD